MPRPPLPPTATIVTKDGSAEVPVQVVSAARARALGAISVRSSAWRPAPPAPARGGKAKAPSSRSGGRGGGTPKASTEPSPTGEGVARGTAGGTTTTKRRVPERTVEECLATIERQWESGFDPAIRAFALEGRPEDLTFSKLVKFFVRPDVRSYAEMAVSVSTAYVLAHEYCGVGAYENAKALIVLGNFFQQVQRPETSLDELIANARNMSYDPVLTYFSRGLDVCFSDKDQSKSKSRMMKFLRKVLPVKYQKVLGFRGPETGVPGMKYVDHISNDWEGGTPSSKSAKHQDAIDRGAEITLVLRNEDDGTKYEKVVNTGAPLKSLFNAYADVCGVSLRALRFSYNGSMLFLSSVGQKSPGQLMMKDGDAIVTSYNQAIGPKSHAPAPPTPKPRPGPRKKSNKGKSKGRSKKEKKQHAPHQPISLPQSNYERDKLAHSKLLTRAFEEMQPKLKVIRQQLNDMALDRQSSKVRKAGTRKKAKEDSMQSNPFDPSTVGLGGKAGRASFVVNVGRPENLYLTAKKGAKSLANAKTTGVANVDLHGLTKEQALERLEASLNDWMNAAMHGDYPWVIPATIVCGAGNQILSETVEKWIRRKKNVANAPKGSV